MDRGTKGDYIEDLIAEQSRLRDMLRQKDDTINVLSAELRRVNEELARRYE